MVSSRHLAKVQGIHLSRRRSKRQAKQNLTENMWMKKSLHKLFNRAAVCLITIVMGKNNSSWWSPPCVGKFESEELGLLPEGPAYLFCSWTYMDIAA